MFGWAHTPYNMSKYPWIASNIKRVGSLLEVSDIEVNRVNKLYEANAIDISLSECRISDYVFLDHLRLLIFLLELSPDKTSPK